MQIPICEGKKTLFAANKSSLKHVQNDICIDMQDRFAKPKFWIILEPSIWSRLSHYISEILEYITWTFSIKHSWKTDVYGVYDRPPTEPNAILLKEIGEHLL